MDTLWRGNSAAIKYVLPVTFIASLTCWAISLSFFVELLTWPLTSNARVRPSEVMLFFYTSAVPMATTLAALVDFVLFCTHYLYPVISLIWSTIAWGVWVYMLTTWGVCEYSSDTGDGDTCPRFYRYDNGEGTSELYGYGGSWRYITRLVFGAIAAIGMLVQLSLASVAVDLKRKEEKARRMKGKYGEVELDGPVR